MDYLVLAYYAFVTVDNPYGWIKKHKQFFKDRDVTGRIYISEEGINGQMSGVKKDASAYMEWLKSQTPFEKMSFKIQTFQGNAFPRMTVKYREQIVALDASVKAADGGEHVSPKRWREMIEEDQDILLIDVRNDYESKIGHFEGAALPPLKQFRDFPKYADDLKSQVDPQKTKVMMYCTGGIRCELYSALLKEKGFKKVYQLDGGVINYGLQEGGKHWKGKLFVFDDRMAIPIANEKSAPISDCDFCGEPSDTYYNCANMDCNALFLSCSDCLKNQKGCCQILCQSAQRVRPFTEERGNKPFRRKSLL